MSGQWGPPYSVRAYLNRLDSNHERRKRRSPRSKPRFRVTLHLMRKVLVIGSPGAGKSTLSQQLGVITGLPVIHLDRLYFRPNWVEPSLEEWISIQEDLVRRDAWIIDGNYGKTLDIRLQVADTVIFLDFSRYVCLWRVLKRIKQYYGHTRDDMAEGCEERFDGEFLRYIWQFPHDQRPRILDQLRERQQRGTHIIHLRRSSDISRLLQSLTTSLGTGEHRF